MAKRVSTAELRNWARAGAKARIQELSAEIERIKAAFPSEFGLRGGEKKPRKNHVRSIMMQIGLKKRQKPNPKKLVTTFQKLPVM